MCDWETLFSSPAGTGVYTVPGARSALIKKAAAAGKFDYTAIDLKGVVDREGLLEKMAGALGFPAYFGMNWDALNDCLTDMGWKPAGGYVVVLRKFAEFSENYPGVAGVAGEVFNSAAQYWKQKAVPFYIILA